MNFIDFQKTFESTPIIPNSEIDIHFPEFERNNLTRWQKKGYLVKIRNGYYRLNRPIQNQDELFVLAGKIYRPSYISLETALAWYGLIPESVFSITSVTHLKTQSFQTPIGHFEYRHLKKELLFGAILSSCDQYFYKIANPVKALLDFLYLRHDLHEAGHFEELRLDLISLQKLFKKYSMNHYLSAFDSHTLNSKIATIQKMMP